MSNANKNVSTLKEVAKQFDRRYSNKFPEINGVGIERDGNMKGSFILCVYVNNKNVTRFLPTHYKNFKVDYRISENQWFAVATA